jgi:hypothetical protein
LREIVEHFESDANLHPKCFPFAANHADGYEPIDYKALATYSVKTQRLREKTIANCRESAHAPPMSNNSESVVCGNAGPST